MIYPMSFNALPASAVSQPARRLDPKALCYPPCIRRKAGTARKVAGDRLNKHGSNSKDISHNDDHHHVKKNAKKKKPEWMKKTEKVLDSTFVTVFMTVITVYALFFDDLRVLYIPL